MPAVAPDINLVAFNTHGQGIPASDEPEPGSPSPPKSNDSDCGSIQHDAAEAIRADASRSPSIYKGAQW